MLHAYCPASVLLIGRIVLSSKCFLTVTVSCHRRKLPISSVEEFTSHQQRHFSSCGQIQHCSFQVLLISVEGWDRVVGGTTPMIAGAPGWLSLFSDLILES